MANKVPRKDILQRFIDNASPKKNVKLQNDNNEIGLGVIECRRNLKKHIKDMVYIQKQLFDISETNIAIEEVDDDLLNNSKKSNYINDIWSTLDTNMDRMMPFIEETIEKWNARTQLYKNIN